MDSEIQTPAETISVPTSEETVTSEVVEQDVQPETQPEQPAKTFTQEELDAIVSKRLAREQRKWEREQQLKLPEKVETASSEFKLEDFSSPEEYAHALAEKRAEVLLAEREARKQYEELLNTYSDREEEAREKYDDYDQVVMNRNLKINEVMANTIRMSDMGPDIAYYLGSNPKEADRIHRLHPLLQPKEIGVIEAMLKSSPPSKKVTSAPPPINPLSVTRTSVAPSYDTTDPRSIKTMSTSEWIAAERERQIRKAQKSR